MITSNALMDGEALRSAASVTAMVYHRPPCDGSAPLMVFLPGGGHLARIAYGYPGCERRDFLDHWLERAGCGLLAVSPPSAPPFTPPAPDLTRTIWAEAVAELVEGALGGQSNPIVLLAWSFASGMIGQLAPALRARGIEIPAFVPLAASPPLPRPAGSYVSEELLGDGGLWDVAGSRVFGIERAASWLGQIATIEAALGRSILPEESYRAHVLVGTPVGLLRGGLKRVDQPAGEPDIADFPLAAPIVPTAESDHRHAIGDIAGWTYVNTQIVLERYARCWISAAAEVGEPAWRRLIGLLDRLPERLSARLPGGHFFFIGEDGARATVATIIDRLAASREVHAELDDILGMSPDRARDRNRVNSPETRTVSHAE